MFEPTASTTPAPAGGGGFFSGVVDFLKPVATAARDDYILENFPERVPAYDNTTATEAGFLTTDEFEAQQAEAEQRLMMLGGAAVLTVVLVALIATRG